MLSTEASPHPAYSMPVCALARNRGPLRLLERLPVAIAPCGFLKNCPGHRREAIDKAPEMGYSKDTKGAASRSAPPVSQRSNRDFGESGTVTSLCYSGEPD